MSVRLAAVAAAMVGGALLIFRWVADASEAVHWVGLVLVALALAPAGASLVGSVLPLRIVVAVAFPVLVASLVELLRPASGAGWYDGLVGVLAVLGAVGALAATSSRDDPVPESRHRAG